MQAKISEIFLSYQGEGPLTGSRQLFLRFYGCNLNCVYCDTVLESYKSFTKEGLLGKILDFGEDYNELSLTGGEPLLHAEFLEDFLTLFKKHRRHKIYLETNGTLPKELRRIIDDVDVVSMDFKLPSATENEEEIWDVHKKFIKIAVKKELIVKVVITDSTTIDDVKKMGDILAKFNDKFVIVLQPITPVGIITEGPDSEMVSYFKGYISKETGKEVRIFGQVHKYMGIK